MVSADHTASVTRHVVTAVKRLTVVRVSISPYEDLIPHAAKLLSSCIH